MNYIDLEHIGKSLDKQISALSDYKALTDQQIEATNDNLENYMAGNRYNLEKLNQYVANGVSINDLNEDLQNSILAAKNAGIDVTELVNKDIYLDSVKADKNDVYSKNESDRKLLDFYTKNQIDEKVSYIETSILNDDSTSTLSDHLDAYIEDSNSVIQELTRQLNLIKSALPDIVNVSSIENPVDIELEINSDIADALPDTITATLSNNTIRNIPVIWKTSTCNTSIAGVYEVTGTLSLPSDVSNTNALAPVVTITIIGNAKSVVSVEEIGEIFAEYGTSVSGILAKLPSTVEVELSDGSSANLTVSWNTQYYSDSSLADQTVIGILNMIQDVINPKKLTVRVTVKIMTHDIVSTESLEQTYERNYNITYNLPSKLYVILDNDSVIEAPVTWDTAAIDSTEIGDTTISGTFDDLPPNIFNPDNVSAVCVIHITENQNNIVLVGKIADVEVPLNTPLEDIELATSTEVTLENGNTTTCSINWNVFDYNGTIPGNYFAYGSLVLGNLVNFNNFTIECAIVVQDSEYINYAWSHKILVPAGASSVANFQALLGETFTQEDFYGPYDEDLDDYDYSKRKLEIRYLGSSLQDTDVMLLDRDILSSYIKKTGITDAYGINGLQVPVGPQDDSIKNAFDNKVVAADEISNRSVDYYAGDLLTFEKKVSSNQIFLVRKTKHSYIGQ